MGICLQNRKKFNLFAGKLMHFLVESAIRLPVLISFWMLGALVVEVEPVQASEIAGSQTVSPDATLAVFDASFPGSSQPARPISQLSELEQPTTTVGDWMAQITQALVQITNVRVEGTESNLQVVLETAEGELSLPTLRSLGNALIVEIPNAVLALPDGNEFQRADPIAGIALVSVTSLPGDRVRVAITGVNAPPTAEVNSANQSLVLSVVPGSVAEGTAQDNAIQVVVTATRTEEELLNIPRSVTVVTREQIEAQAQFTQSLADILAQTVPGFAPPTNRSNTFGQTLRGRGISVLIDGIPQNTNLGSIPAPLTTIAPDAIERIEVVRGSTAVYGANATGGVVNIITRRPTTDQFQQTVEIGTNAPLSADAGSNFGYNLGYSISGAEGSIDWFGGLSYATTRGLFDAEGDRIANFAGDDDSLFLNGLLRLGVELDEQQRLEFTANHYRQTQDTNFISDPALDELPGVRKSRALEIEGVEVFGASDTSSLTTTNLTLQYLHDDLLNSRVRVQAFYRDYQFGGGIPSDNREFLGFISTSPGGSQQWGGRLQGETALNSQETLSLLWGVDFVRESSSQNFDLFDPQTFDSSNGRVFRRIGEITFVPDYSVNDLGIFTQLQWEVGDLNVSAGARYVNLNVSTDDYTTFNNRDIEGGTINVDDVVFNAGLVYNLTDELSVFTSFAQGFSIPDIGRVLRRPPAGFAVGSSIDLTSPEKVNNYEVGIRGLWGRLQASIAGFFSESSLGSSFALPADGGPLRTIRAPRRNYGIEMTLDWQPADRWELGGTLTWQEGEIRENDDGEFLALNSIVNPPLKLTAYVENETTPGWWNRLQILYSGERSRAFNDGVDDLPIESYITLDFLSRLRLGRGELVFGIQNLLNEQYFPVYSQYFAPSCNSCNYAGRGRTISLIYRHRF